MARGLDDVWFESQSQSPINAAGGGKKMTTTTTATSRLTGEKKSQSKVRSEGKGVGSRRIFSPIFKLQVLDSYRHDADCQGNQRATARKYGIHRRQIQKWLQMETSLRMSVQQQQQQQQQSSANCCAALNLSCSIAGAGAATKNLDRDSPVNGGEKVILMPATSSVSYSLSSCSSASSSGKETSSSDSEEYINVDEVTDDSDDDDDDEDNSSSCSSSYDKALDFTRATLSKRRFYTTDFKLHVLDAFRTDDSCKGNQRATARKFGIHRRQVQKWLNREHLIKNEQTADETDRRQQDGNNNLCLDLSQQSKRKVVDQHPYECSGPKRKFYFHSDEVFALENNEAPAGTTQEFALCLVKEKPENSGETAASVITTSSSSSTYSNLESENRTTSGNSNGSAIMVENAFGTATGVTDYHQPRASSIDYSPSPMYCLCTPWTCCYQHIAPDASSYAVENAAISYSKYGYHLFDFKVSTSKYETSSYVDIPLQYGFGDSLTPKWLKDPQPFYLHDQPANIPLLSSYSR